MAFKSKNILLKTFLYSFFTDHWSLCVAYNANELRLVMPLSGNGFTSALLYSVCVYVCVWVDGGISNQCVNMFSA